MVYPILIDLWMEVLSLFTRCKYYCRVNDESNESIQLYNCRLKK